MAQSMFAIVALMILSLFVFHQRRGTIHMQNTMVQNAVSVIANGVAVERLSKIRTMSFDQATAGGTFVNSSASLTQRAGFGPSQDTENDDIDDFDGAVKDIHRVVDEDSLAFRVESSVRYADEDDLAREASSSARTKFKKVTVKVYSLNLPDPDTVRISQIIACKHACNW